MARHLACCAIIEASKGNNSFFKDILDRTEGKVADILVNIDGNDFMRQIEQARSRVLNAASGVNG